MKYQVIHSDTVDKLETKVAKAIEDGWVPLGGVCVVNDADGWYQAMIMHMPEMATLY